MIAESTSLRARRRVFVRSSRFAHMVHMKRGARAAEPGYWPKGARHVASRPFFACGAP